MQAVFADYMTNITDFKKNTENVLEQAQTATVVILAKNKPSAYIIPATEYEDLLERLEDYELGLLVKERAAEKPKAVEVSIDDL
ncbi:type II toxin-antitoxin system Phd/YefM family antitoxin [Candidatus Marithrix sp. Canyon 246]|uniref:type II toxin-antitoxin system Phd/YefM family antitoxin n=1 Tax=Candidatus Marithrix sp. Canyon 246 TaxID=1827136 RepID=UPI00084A2A3A|nr:type II toxin-antitoxin system prevent-host-death family antitoxin [Candidatus Marithrix sp. Canyon 246]